jgi:hypothetical protein
MPARTTRNLFDRVMEGKAAIDAALEATTDSTARSVLAAVRAAGVMQIVPSHLVALDKIVVTVHPDVYARIFELADEVQHGN